MTTILWVLSICLARVGHYAPDYAQDTMHNTISLFAISDYDAFYKLK